MIRRDHLLPALLAPAALIAPAYAVDYLTVTQAQAVLFPDATAFAEHAVVLTPAQRKEIKALSGVAQRGDRQAVWKAAKDGAFLGWFLVDDVVGKHEFITYAVAISPAGSVLGIEIMSYRETHGGEVRDATWRANFAGKTLREPFKLDQDVPNISGATLSARNVMNGVKRLLALRQVALPDA
jgi:Na+-translocating ferredoxin:NAD+ oxidoreductase RnfG subunit